MLIALMRLRDTKQAFSRNEPKCVQECNYKKRTPVEKRQNKAELATLLLFALSSRLPAVKKQKTKTTCVEKTMPGLFLSRMPAPAILFSTRMDDLEVLTQRSESVWNETVEATDVLTGWKNVLSGDMNQTTGMMKNEKSVHQSENDTVGNNQQKGERAPVSFFRNRVQFLRFEAMN